MKVVTCPNCQRRNRVPAVAEGTPRCGNCGQPLPWIVDAGDNDFAEVVEQSSLPVLVDLWAPWCGPCRRVSPVLEQLATEKRGQLKLVKINADEAPKLSERFEIRSIPTLMVLRNGEVVATQIGAASAPALRPWLEEALAKETTS
ncbi:thioredoxin TrxC [Kribbella kalugense]|uniref:Thioredoxin n=1 Tax=Kribbella kalugense TaxID=2512221 RepID=A0A4R7ZTJ0_9ACTN|nr:thioredoxin TrxC [Kribbella kalugense]TDW21353.1 thioredoxin [Kribbella kalugense]